MSDRGREKRGSEVTFPVALRSLDLSQALSFRFEGDELSGFFIRQVGRFLCWEVLDDSSRLDGITCTRVDRVKKLRSDGRASIHERAVAMRGQVRLPPSALSKFDTPAQMVKAASSVFGLVTFFDKRRLDEVTVARVLEVDDAVLRLQPISRSAVYYPEEEVLEWKHVVRFEFASSYEEALAMASGSVQSSYELERSRFLG